MNLKIFLALITVFSTSTINISFASHELKFSDYWSRAINTCKIMLFDTENYRSKLPEKGKYGEKTFSTTADGGLTIARIQNESFSEQLMFVKSNEFVGCQFYMTKHNFKHIDQTIRDIENFLKESDLEFLGGDMFRDFAFSGSVTEARNPKFFVNIQTSNGSIPVHIEVDEGSIAIRAYIYYRK